MNTSKQGSRERSRRSNSKIPVITRLVRVIDPQIARTYYTLHACKNRAMTEGSMDCTDYSRAMTKREYPDCFACGSQ